MKRHITPRDHAHVKPPDAHALHDAGSTTVAECPWVCSGSSAPERPPQCVSRNRSVRCSAWPPSARARRRGRRGRGRRAVGAGAGLVEVDAVARARETVALVRVQHVFHRGPRLTPNGSNALNPPPTRTGPRPGPGARGPIGRHPAALGWRGGGAGAALRASPQPSGPTPPARKRDRSSDVARFGERWGGRQ